MRELLALVATAALILVAASRWAIDPVLAAGSRSATDPVLAAGYRSVEPAPSGSLTRHDYVLNCAGCHKFDGSGSARIPDLHGISELIGRPGWREYLMRVPGAAQAPLSDARLAALLVWVVERFGGASPRPPFSAEEVGRLRTRPLRDPIRARRDLPSRRSIAGSVEAVD